MSIQPLFHDPITADEDAPVPTVHKTRDYSIFELHDINRNTMAKEKPKHRELLVSMRADGFWPTKPVTCYYDANTGRYVVTDGNNRVTVAKYLNLPVYYLVSAGPVSVRENNPVVISTTTKKWSVLDKIDSGIRNGESNYIVLYKFAKQLKQQPKEMHAAVLLGSPMLLAQAKKAIEDGGFRVTPEGVALANKVALVYAPIVALPDSDFKAIQNIVSSRAMSAMTLMLATMPLDPNKMGAQLRTYVEDLQEPCHSRQAYINKFETLYNKRSQHSNRIYFSDYRKEQELMAVAAKKDLIAWLK